MATTERNAVFELQADFRGGANSFDDPVLLSADDIVWGVNITKRTGFPETRPPFRELGLLPTGRIQSASYFSTDNGAKIAFVVDGRAYLLTVTESDISYEEISIVEERALTIADYNQPALEGEVLIELTDTTKIGENDIIRIEGGGHYLVVDIINDTNLRAVFLNNQGDEAPLETILAGAKVFVITTLSSSEERLSSFQAGKYLLVMGAKSQTLIYDGASPRFASKDNNEVPPGNLGVYGNGRIWVAKGKYLFAGDLEQSDGSQLLSFQSNTYVSGGGGFVFPSEIMALAFLPRMDDSTEYGDLLVFERTRTHAIKAYVFDRDRWQSVSGMQRILFPRIGAEGQGAIAQANLDLYTRSYDGMRSIRNTAADSQDSGNSPISENANRVFSQDTDKFLKFSEATVFDNRLLTSAEFYIQPCVSHSTREVTQNIVAKKLVALDLAPTYRKGNIRPPSYDGEWQGLAVSKIVSGFFLNRERCFAFACDSDGKNRLYEILKQGDFDEFAGEKRRIASSVETRAFTFGNPATLKQLQEGKFWMSKLLGQVDVDFYYKSDYYPCYNKWKSHQFNQAYETCNLEACQIPPTLAYGYTAPPILAKLPKRKCLDYTSQQSHFGYFFQFLINWVGKARLDRILIKALNNDEPNKNGCELLS